MQTLDAPGATLAYEVLGSGPVLVLIGHPMPSGGLRALAAELAGERTVVLHDPRGTGESPMTDPTEAPDPEVLADDLSRVLAAVTDAPADVFGTSGGAVTALALATRHPEQVRTVVAHEPPLTEYLPDAEQLRAGLAGVAATHREHGVPPRWARSWPSPGCGCRPPTRTLPRRRPRPRPTSGR